jgi:hypothetical protein
MSSAIELSLRGVDILPDIGDCCGWHGHNYFDLSSLLVAEVVMPVMRAVDE